MASAFIIFLVGYWAGQADGKIKLPPTMPTTLYINSLPYKVVRSSPGVGFFGLTNCKQREIEIDPAVTDDRVPEIILHEVQHGFTCDGTDIHNEYFNNLTPDHEGIHFATGMWEKFIKENPQAIDFIQRAGS